MSETNTSIPLEEQPLPTIVYGTGPETDVAIDPLLMADTLRELSVSDTGIQETTIVVDPKNRFVNRGTHYPNVLGKLRFRSIPEVQSAKGDVVRLSTKMRGKEVPAESLNRSLTHEFVHRAQQERGDRNVTEGHIAIYGLAMVGAIAGNLLARKLGGGKAARRIAGTVGGFVGYQTGYVAAPHERQARAIAGNSKRKGQITSTAVRRKHKHES